MTWERDKDPVSAAQLAATAGCEAIGTAFRCGKCGGESLTARPEQHQPTRFGASDKRRDICRRDFCGRNCPEARTSVP